MTLVAITPDNGLMSGFSAYANLSYLNELLDMGGAEYMSFGIYLPSLDGMDRYAEEFYRGAEGASEREGAEEPSRADDSPMSPMAMFFGPTRTRRPGRASATASRR